MNDYIKRSDLASNMSDLLISPWALEGGAVSVGRREALLMVQDMANDEVPDNFRLPNYDVVEVVQCKDCEYSYDSIGGWVCSHGPCVDCIVPGDFFCKYGKRKEGEE